MAYKNQKKDDIVLNFHESLLRLSDVKLLEGPHWLNDQLIGFCFEYYEQEQFNNFADQLCFVAPEVTQFIKSAPGEELGVFVESLKLDSKQYIFIAINNHACLDRPGGSHWSLLVFHRNPHEFHLYDSLAGSTVTTATNVARKLLPHLKTSSVHLNVVEKNCPQQTNGYDCGVFVIAITEHLCNNIVGGATTKLADAVTSATISAKRRQILDLIHDLARSNTSPR